jgi:hypothetical protein
MKFPAITKAQGFFLSVICILIYDYGFYQYHVYCMDRPPVWTDWDARIFFMGAIIHMMYYLPTAGILVFFGKTVEGAYWEEGLCMVPNLLHFTIHAFGFALLWGVKLLGEHLVGSQSKVLVEIFKDQQKPAMPNYNYNVEMSHGRATLDRAMNSFLFWFFGWKNGERHLVMMRFGFRMLLVAVAWTSVGGLTTYTNRKANEALEKTNQILDDTARDLSQKLGPSQ